MKKFLAVLLVALVAVTAVFAEATYTNGAASGSTLNLTQTIDSTVVWTIQYQMPGEENWTNLTENADKGVDLTKNGTVGLQVLLDANTSTAINRKFTITATNFQRNENGTPVDAVTTRLSLTGNTVDGKFSTTDGQDGINVSVPAFTRMGGADTVIEGTLTWTGDDALIAGDYVATITFTYTGA